MKLNSQPVSRHYIIADQCLKNEMKLVSLAPRFIGEFEKGSTLSAISNS